MLSSDIDECDAGSHNCASEASCTDNVGSYDCTCDMGYTGNGTSCNGLHLPFFKSRPKHTHVDIDECESSNSECDSNGTCANNPGSYDCFCKVGYTGDGFSCTGEHEPLGIAQLSILRETDINECVTGIASCGENAECSNTEGSYTCFCLLGDGALCTGRYCCVWLGQQ